ncbi:LVIVD repeat-containing protein [Acidisphaera sp. S103]|uniref:LVIVD repeat-containing protein n=1 Tax=Acidisphaera sp. S103 TaxID=1747223 RepID=UPI001C2017D9|nr:hypothetical protein [Acidisphaera sp. S103]
MGLKTIGGKGMITADGARNISLVGHTDQNGRGDGVQVMVHRGHAYIGTRVSRGIVVTDVRDPRNPKPVNFMPIHPNSWCMHLQTANDLLLCIEELDLKALLSLKDYYSSSNQVDSSRYGKRGEDFSAGMRVYDVSDPANPRPIGFMEVEGLGLHRIWWTGGRYAYASALLDGFLDHIFICIDMADPTKPREVGRWWIPGMNAAAGEEANWKGRCALHHAVVEDDIAYASWRDGGLTILDVKDKTKPELIVHRKWSPPFPGGTHSALPLHDRNLLLVADEATLNIDQEEMKRTWIFDIREKSNPVSIATLPTPSDRDYVKIGGQFGPHNLHENRPGSFQSSTTIFATWQSAGVRVFDIADPYRPAEIGFWVPPQPTKWMEPMRGRAKIRHTADLFVQKDGLIYITDYDAGLFILQWEGA